MLTPVTGNIRQRRISGASIVGFLWYTVPMLAKTGFVVLGLCARAFSCGGMSPCPDVGDMNDPERIAILRQRIAASPAVFLVLPPAKDTLKVSLDSKTDSICPVDFRIARYRSEIIPLNGAGAQTRASVHCDTFGLQFSCPNTNCVHEYSCTLPEQVRRGGDRDGLQCRCDGLYSLGGEGGMGGGCEYFLIRLGKDAGGLLFGSEEPEKLGRVPKECPTDVRRDEWIPLVKDSLEIRTMKTGKIAIRKIALSDVINPIPSHGRPQPSRH